jgi:hypothetical protein
MNRFDYLLKHYRESREKDRKDRILMRSRSEPNIWHGGTQGYVVKAGENTGKYLSHHSPKSTNNW